MNYEKMTKAELISKLKSLESRIEDSKCREEEIARHRQLEERLKDSLEQSRAWLENSPICTKIVDLDFNLQYMSAAGIKALKVDDVTTLYGKPYPFDFYPELFQDCMTKNLEITKKTGEITTQEASVVDIEGNELWFHSTLVPVNDDKGRIDFIIIVSVDTTERKRAANELVNIYNLSLDMIWTGTLNGILTKINPSSKQILGYEINEMIGKSFLEYVHPEDIAQTKNELTKALMGECEHYIENRYRCKNGDYKWIAWTALSVESENVFYTIGRDITEHKQAADKIEKLNETLEQRMLERTEELAQVNNEINESEARFRSILSSLYEAAIIVYDRNGKIMSLWGTPEMDKRYGIVAVDVVGRSIRDFIHPEQVKQEIANIRNVINTGKKLFLNT